MCQDHTSQALTSSEAMGSTGQPISRHSKVNQWAASTSSKFKGEQTSPPPAVPFAMQAKWDEKDRSLNCVPPAPLPSRRGQLKLLRRGNRMGSPHYYSARAVGQPAQPKLGGTAPTDIPEPVRSIKATQLEEPSAHVARVAYDQDGDAESSVAKLLREQGEHKLESHSVLDQERGVQLLFQAMGEGSAIASYKLGLACAKAQGGFPRDQAAAVELWEPAADRGNSDACFALGCCFEMGRGVKQCVDRAQYLWRIAAQRGQKQAMFMYPFSIGHKENAMQDPGFAAFVTKNKHNKPGFKPDLDACLHLYAGVCRRRCLYS